MDVWRVIETKPVSGLAMPNDGTWNVGDKISGEFQGKPFSGVVIDIDSKNVYITLDAPIAFLCVTDKVEEPCYQMIATFRREKVGK